MKRHLRFDSARWPAAALMVLMSAWPRPALGQPAPDPGRLRLSRPVAEGPALTLERAVRQALTRSPAIAAAEAALGEARGRLTTAGVYPYNPVVRGQVGSRQGAGSQFVDFTSLLFQQVEIAGQRGHRVDSARAALEAERARLLRTKRLQAARVHLAFVSALEARELLAVAGKDTTLTRRLYDLARRRLERGAGTQLDVNVAAAELGRSEARFQAAEASYRAERAALAEVIGLEATTLPLPEGDLRVPLDELPPLARVLESAANRRADLEELRRIEVASQARQQLARSEAWPDVTLRAFANRDGRETIFGGGVEIPIPLFDRNQGQIEETRAAAERARAERGAGELSVKREVVTAHARYEAGARTAERLRQLVLGTLEQNIELLQRSFEAGKATWPEVVVIRRTLIDAERELTAAEANARRAWIELQVAAGRLPMPGQDGQKEQEP